MQLPYVVSFVNICSRSLIFSQEYIKSAQSALEATLVKVITTPEPYLPPGRALRTRAARCFVALYSRGETRTLFDTLQTFMKVVGDFKTPDKDMNKMYGLLTFVPFTIRLIPTRRAAFYCVGELMAVFGAQVRKATAWAVTLSKSLQSVHVLHG
jgi:hypothetical protein